jgi:hypothetical protein
VNKRWGLGESFEHYRRGILRSPLYDGFEPALANSVSLPEDDTASLTQAAFCDIYATDSA